MEFTLVKVIVEAGDFSCLSLESRKKAFLMAAGLGHRDITKYLFKLTELQFLEHEEMRRLYIYCVEMGLYELATKMHVIPQICLAPDQEVTALSVFARTPSAFSDESQSSGMFNRFARLFKEFLKFDEEAQIFDTREAEKSLFIDAEVGIVDFIIKLIELNPNLLWTTDDEKGSFFHVAVQHRQEKIFSLLLELGGIKEVIAKVTTGSKRNSLLHLVAELPPDREKLNTVCGAALQLHRELVWFKEVEKIIPTAYKDMKNSDEKTAQALFAKTHKELRKEGEKWMKEAAQSSKIVATLIAGAIFAATFSVPGGFDTSILMFLSILTSRYAQNDFLKFVPVMLLIGFTSLFASITAMMFDRDNEYMSHVLYFSVVGSLMYTMLCTHPDIAHAISVVSQYMANLEFGRSKEDVIGYVDADFVGDLDRRRSTTRYVFTLGDTVGSPFYSQ
nr:uncharacterized protein LOC125423440 [Ziziphus jujuba var. spinosa]